MKIIVTGASGFIGSHMLTALSAKGHEVMGLDLIQSPPPNATRFILGDLMNINWQEIYDWQPECLIHLAGPASVAASFGDMFSETKNSLLLTSFLLEKLRFNPDIKLIYMSSAAVYGNHDILKYSENLTCNPVSPYGVCKLASEQMIRIAGETLGLKYTIIRPFSVYGPGLRKQVIYDLAVRFISAEDPIIIQSTGKENRDFVHISDCCSIVCELLHKDYWNGFTFNIGIGRPVSLKKLVSLISEYADVGSQIIFSGEDRPGNPFNLVADETALNSFGLSCKISLEEGLRETMETIKKELLN